MLSKAFGRSQCGANIMTIFRSANPVNIVWRFFYIYVFAHDFEGEEVDCVAYSNFFREKTKVFADTLIKFLRNFQQTISL